MIAPGRSLAVLATVLLCQAQGRCTTKDIEGYWTGHLSYYNVPWEIGLEIQKNDTGHIALLDIPSLIMAWEPIPCRTQGRAVIVTFPFGVGAIPLRNHGDTIRSANTDFTVELMRSARPVYPSQEVGWQNKEVSLRGTLYYPQRMVAGMKVPLIILTHGAGAGNRGKWAYRSYAKFYLERGLAVLLYDRRASGASTGDNDHASLNDLKDDLLAGLARVKGEPGIDPQRIGVGGGSQAAYIGFMAAAESSDIHFLIHSGASAVSMDDQEMQNVVYVMRAEGEPPAMIDTAKAYMRLYFYYAATGDRWPVLDSLARVAQEARWGGYLDQPMKCEHMDWWRLNHNVYRPELVLPKVHVPTLLLYGEKDYIVPPQEQTGLVEFYFRQAGNNALTIRVIPGALHSLELPSTPEPDGSFRWPRKAPELFEAVDAFLKTYVR